RIKSGMTIKEAKEVVRAHFCEYLPLRGRTRRWEIYFVSRLRLVSPPDGCQDDRKKRLDLLPDQRSAQPPQFGLGAFGFELGQEQAALGLDELLLHLAQFYRGDGAEAEALQRHLHVEAGGFEVFLFERDELQAVLVASIQRVEVGFEAGAYVGDGERGAFRADLCVLRAPPPVEAVEQVVRERSAIGEVERAAGDEEAAARIHVGVAIPERQVQPRKALGGDGAALQGHGGAGELGLLQRRVVLQR